MSLMYQLDKGLIDSHCNMLDIVIFYNYYYVLCTSCRLLRGLSLHVSILLV